MTEFFKQFFYDANNKYSVVIEDDGKVCYAYLMDNKEIAGDVWLYNSSQTPEKVDWSEKDAMPFLNPMEFVDLRRMPKPLNNSSDIKINWNLDSGGVLVEATISISNTLVAKLSPGKKPGWSTVAIKDGPLARRLS